MLKQSVRRLFEWSQLFKFLFAMVLTTGVASAGIYWTMGTVGATLSWFKGNSIYLPTSQIMCDFQKNGPSEYPLTVMIKNLTYSKVNLIGSKTSCSCTTVAKMPIQMAPFQMIPIQLKIRPKKDNRSILVKVKIFTDLAAQSSLPIEITGRYPESQGLAKK